MEQELVSRYITAIQSPHSHATLPRPRFTRCNERGDESGSEIEVLSLLPSSVALSHRRHTHIIPASPAIVPRHLAHLLEQVSLQVRFRSGSRASSSTEPGRHWEYTRGGKCMLVQMCTLRYGGGKGSDRYSRRHFIDFDCEPSPVSSSTRG